MLPIEIVLLEESSEVKKKKKSENSLLLFIPSLTNQIIIPSPPVYHVHENGWTKIIEGEDVNKLHYKFAAEKGNSFKIKIFFKYSRFLNLIPLLLSSVRQLGLNGHGDETGQSLI